MNTFLDGEFVKFALVACFFVGVAVVFLLSLAWVYQDAQARGKSGIAVAVLCAFISWPLSLFAWVVLRPEERKPRSVPPQGFLAD